MTHDYRYPVLSVSVVDGDTVDLILDLGFRITRQDRFRLYGPEASGDMGLNAPELKTDAGIAAKAWLVSEVVIAARDLVAQTVKDKRDKYGRWLVVLLVQQPNGTCRNLNAAMVAAGHAVLKKY